MNSAAKKAAVALASAGLAVAGAAGAASADAGAEGAAVGSPGVLSGNLVQVPVHIPVNVCGNSVDVIGLLNPAFGNVCVND
ncbi:chaplin [Streptomyces sp. NPDC059564]|uniref:chaplin n=1 Tax=Streptomyces sp. NPDC059564 TaxID=3346865 RepID=UPI0036C7398F